MVCYIHICTSAEKISGNPPLLPLPFRTTEQRPSILNKVAGGEKLSAEKNVNKVSAPLTYQRR